MFGKFNETTAIVSKVHENSHLQNWHIDYEGDLIKYYNEYKKTKMTSLSSLHCPMGGSLAYMQCDVDTSIAIAKEQQYDYNRMEKIAWRKGL